jgi:hypothetical protein
VKRMCACVCDTKSARRHLTNLRALSSQFPSVSAPDTRIMGDSHMRLGSEKVLLPRASTQSGLCRALRCVASPGAEVVLVVFAGATLDLMPPFLEAAAAAAVVNMLPVAADQAAAAALEKRGVLHYRFVRLCVRHPHTTSPFPRVRDSPQSGCPSNDASPARRNAREGCEMVCIGLTCSGFRGW